MPVELKIETEGNPEQKTVGCGGHVLRVHCGYVRQAQDAGAGPEQPRAALQRSDSRGGWPSGKARQFEEVSDFTEALKEYQKALEVNHSSSLSHYRIAEVFFLQNNYQAAGERIPRGAERRPGAEVDPKYGPTSTWARFST